MLKKLPPDFKTFRERHLEDSLFSRAELPIAEMTVEDFLADLASDSPAPGSGSAAAVTAAKAAALVEKVCRLTIGKSKYIAVESEMLGILATVNSLRAALLIYAEADKNAFLRVIASKGSVASLREAAASVAEIARMAEEIQCLAKVVATKGNKKARAEANLALDLARVAKSNALLIAKMNQS